MLFRYTKNIEKQDETSCEPNVFQSETDYTRLYPQRKSSSSKPELKLFELLSCFGAVIELFGGYRWASPFGASGLRTMAFRISGTCARGSSHSMALGRSLTGPANGGTPNLLHPEGTGGGQRPVDDGEDRWQTLPQRPAIKCRREKR